MYREKLLEEIKDFIESHLGEELTLGKISDRVCYSEEYLSRLFKKATGENLFDYIRGRRLVEAAKKLRDGKGRIVDTAFDFGFRSHEVFTRAFTGYFGITPLRFRQLKPEIKHFMPRGMKAYPLEFREKIMDYLTVFTQIMEKEERLLLFYPGKKATHYFEYCEEAGCDVWGKLMGMKGTLGEPLGLWLPAGIRPDGCSEYVQGVEMPSGYSGPVPEGMASLSLSAGAYLVFKSRPYEESDEKMMEVIQTVQKSMKEYDPQWLGYEWDQETAPRYQLMPLGERGYVEALPLRPYKN
jgi:AraC family transcriptional regulator